MHRPLQRHAPTPDGVCRRAVCAPSCNARWCAPGRAVPSPSRAVACPRAHPIRHGPTRARLHHLGPTCRPARLTRVLAGARARQEISIGIRGWTHGCVATARVRAHIRYSITRTLPHTHSPRAVAPGAAQYARPARALAQQSGATTIQCHPATPPFNVQPSTSQHLSTSAPHNRSVRTHRGAGTRRSPVTLPRRVPLTSPHPAHRCAQVRLLCAPAERRLPRIRPGARAACVPYTAMCTVPRHPRPPWCARARVCAVCAVWARVCPGVCARARPVHLTRAMALHGVASWGGAPCRAHDLTRVRSAAVARRRHRQNSKRRHAVAKFWEQNGRGGGAGAKSLRRLTALIGMAPEVGPAPSATQRRIINRHLIQRHLTPYGSTP